MATPFPLVLALAKPSRVTPRAQGGIDASITELLVLGGDDMNARRRVRRAMRSLTT